MNRFSNGLWARWSGLAGLLAAATLAACGGGGGGGEVSAGQGTLRVALTDAPSCYEHVYITVEKVRVHQSSTASDTDGGWTELVLSPPRRIDLLNLTNGVLEELGSVQLAAGSYSQVRLVLAENGGSAPFANAVQAAGQSQVALRTPSAQQSGLKLQAHFTVAAGQTADLVLDFDACKSVVRAGNSGNFNLKPVVSVTPRFTAGIQGYVTTTLSLGSTTVSAQQNGVVVRSTVPDANGRFMLAFLADGAYNVVVTSEGRATAAVTGVPVASATGTTNVNGTATAIVLPVSTMSVVSGVATLGPTTLATEATVTALQNLTGGPTIQVASTAVNADLATYSLRLPQAAPVRAPYATAGLAFTADTAAAGKYRVQAATAGRTAVEQAVDVAAALAATVNLAFAP